MTDAKKSKKKSPMKKSFSGKTPSKKPTTRSGRIFRGPLFWILVAIFGVSIFGQISAAGNRYTQIETSQALEPLMRLRALQLNQQKLLIKIKRFA